MPVTSHWNKPRGSQISIYWTFEIVKVVLDSVRIYSVRLGFAVSRSRLGWFFRQLGLRSQGRLTAEPNQTEYILTEPHRTCLETHFSSNRIEFCEKFNKGKFGNQTCDVTVAILHFSFNFFWICFLLGCDLKISILLKSVLWTR